MITSGILVIPLNRLLREGRNPANKRAFVRKLNRTEGVK
jgi:hypothetical protein